MLETLLVALPVIAQYSSSTSSSGSAGAAAGSFLFLLFYGILWLVMGYVLSKVFDKAGITGWWGYVPFLNTWGLVKIAGRDPLWFVLLFIPCVNFVVWVILSID